MTRMLTLPLARKRLTSGLLAIAGCLASTAGAEDRALHRTVDPAVLPASDEDSPIDNAAGIEPFTLPLSATAQKLVLVSAEIDAEADQPHVVQLEKGSSSRRVRRAAIQELPTRYLTQSQRAAVDDVVESLSVFRRLPAFQCELDPRVYEYFTQHPDVAVSIWRAMAISRLQMTQRNPLQYDIDTQDGTTGVVTLLHKTRDECLVHCDGMFKSPYLNNAIHAKSLILLRTSYATDQEGRVFVTQQADLFVSFPSQKIGTIAKLVSPVSNAIMDRNFEEVCLFVNVMWQAMTKQPGWVEQIARRLDGVPPVRKDELIQLTADVYVTKQTNLLRRNGRPVSLEVIRPPESLPPRDAANRPIDVTQ